MPGSTGLVDHLVFTDGFASVSVFVETQQARRRAERRAGVRPRVGSSSAFSTVVDGHKVTAVGEVPPETVRFIALAGAARSRTPAPASAAPGRR